MNSKTYETGAFQLTVLYDHVILGSVIILLYFIFKETNNIKLGIYQSINAVFFLLINS